MFVEQPLALPGSAYNIHLEAGNFSVGTVFILKSKTTKQSSYILLLGTDNSLSLKLTNPLLSNANKRLVHVGSRCRAETGDRVVKSWCHGRRGTQFLF